MAEIRGVTYYSTASRRLLAQTIELVVMDRHDRGDRRTVDCAPRCLTRFWLFYDASLRGRRWSDTKKDRRWEVLMEGWQE